MNDKILTSEQETILSLFKNDDFLKENFYFTGGTALSSCYLQHRYSDDLDFFSEAGFDNFGLASIMQKWADGLGAVLDSHNVGETYIYNLNFQNGIPLKVDFAHYPYKRVSPSILIDGIYVDSLEDMAVNKFVMISQRTDVKDFVDLYFLLEKFGVIELSELARKKFRRDFDLMLFAADLVKMDTFEYLPKMTEELPMPNLKNFYRRLAENLGQKATLP